MTRGNEMGTGDSYGDHGHDEMSVLVRSLALSTGKLWEELFERIDRLEDAQRELRTLVARIERALPGAAQVPRAAPVPAGRPTGREQPGGTRGLRTEGSDRATTPGLLEPDHVMPTVPPVWAPAPLALAHHRRSETSQPSPPASDVSLPGSPPAAVPPPPAGYVVFRLPASPAGTTAVRTGPTSQGPAFRERRPPMRVIGGPGSAAPDSNENGATHPPPIAPDFFARAHRRRH